MKVGEIIAQTEWMPSQRYGADTPRISVLLPTFRRCSSGLFLKAATSVLNQSVEDLELIIIDDGSTDGTADQISELMQRDARVSCLRHPRNVGLPAISEFEGYIKARADFLAFAFDDTEFSPTALEEMLNLANTRGLPFLHGYVRMSVDDEVTGIRREIPLGRSYESQASLQNYNYIPNNAVVVHRRALEHVGLYDPHVCMARLCDWDLWRRVAAHYKIEFVDVFIGYEYGPSMADSLGRTVLLDLWTVNEWMKTNRNSKLKPDVFCDFDVLAIPDQFTRQAKYIIKDLGDQYRDKFWYRDVPVLLPGNKETGGAGSVADNGRTNGYILVVAPIHDASISLCFDYLPEDLSRKIRIIRGGVFMGCEEEMVGASAVIIARNLFEFLPWVEYAKKLGIPLYYYTDDNFMELGRAPGCPPEYKRHRPETVKKILEGFSGVLLSSAALIECFRSNRLHDKLYYLPPIAKPAAAQIPGSSDDANERFTIAFLGGPHRAENFFRYVVPAIRRLAQTAKIRMCLPGSESETQRINELLSPAGNLEIRVIPRDISYDLTIRNYREHKPDVLVHINSNTGNNPYMTKNVLINAMLLGAVPVVSDEEPYRGVKDENIALLCPADEDSWYEALKGLSDNRAENSKIYERLTQYCRQYFSGAENETVLNGILSRHPVPNMALKDARYKQLIKLKDPVHQSRMIFIIRWLWAKVRQRFGGLRF